MREALRRPIQRHPRQGHTLRRAFSPVSIRFTVASNFTNGGGGDPEICSAEPGAMAAGVETMPQDISLLLAQRSRCFRELWRSLPIEDDFGLPEPEARTLVERRVVVVRAFLLERGAAPARLVVHVSGDLPVAPPTTSTVRARSADEAFD
jgi:hypothetical protein